MSDTAPADRSPATVSADHHGSHQGLLHKPLEHEIRPRPVDAIIVPTVRYGTALEPAIKLAEDLRSTLVVLCSKWSSTEAIAALARRRNVDLVAIDVRKLPDGLMPEFQADKVIRGGRFERWTDTSLKRNLGLLLARLVGWERIVFLDDDIIVSEPKDLADAAGLTDTYAGVGLAIGGYPDNSVVCHAYREAGGAQETFVGGGALAVGASSLTSFFPNIYNEDWFFLLGEKDLRPTSTAGTALQRPYDPFADEMRARLEELGDCLAEGLFWLFDNKKQIKDADAAYWRQALDRRISFISKVITMVKAMSPDAAQKRMLASVKAARGRCQLITPELCVRYLDAWQADRLTWRIHSDMLFSTHAKGREDRSPRTMISALGLGSMTTFVSQRLDHDVADLDLALPIAVGE
ncbi:hypothetical protein [Actinophytocola sp.]|jgi:hypothetical protein|uniref:hypothetical protein n=1 Tax=Actinophytocola sp. TaxID=1872138 RepID=UPI002ED779C8